MVLQTYGLSIHNDDECVENRLIGDSDEIISDRKGVNYSDTMLAMSPFAGDYPPTTNYINYTDLDASYATQGKDFFFFSVFNDELPVRRNRDCRWFSMDPWVHFGHCFTIHCSPRRWCTLVHTLKPNTNSMSPEVAEDLKFLDFQRRRPRLSFRSDFPSKNNFRTKESLI